MSKCKRDFWVGGWFNHFTEFKWLAVTHFGISNVHLRLEHKACSFSLFFLFKLYAKKCLLLLQIISSFLVIKYIQPFNLCNYNNISKYKKVGDAFDSLRTIRVPAKDGRSGQDIQLQYSHQKVIGNGSFGVVYQVKLDHNGEDAAIKKVLQDKRFKVNFNTIIGQYSTYSSYKHIHKILE